MRRNSHGYNSSTWERLRLKDHTLKAVLGCTQSDSVSGKKRKNPISFLCLYQAKSKAVKGSDLTKIRGCTGVQPSLRGESWPLGREAQKETTRSP